MPYVRLGNSGLKVSKIILGCMSYGSPDWQKWVLGEEEALKHIKAAYDAGIQTFDTADVYSNGESERILGNAIKHFNLPREEIVVMTKLFSVVGRDAQSTFALDVKTSESMGYVNQRGLSRKHIFDAVDIALKRLQLDYIDVMQCHRFDSNTPISETMQALHDVVQSGKVRYIGMSSCWAWEFHAMQNYAINNKLTPFISMQNHYSLLYREEEREMMPTLKMFGVGSIPWSPLARGLLTRPIGESSLRSSVDLFTQNNFKDTEAQTAIIQRVEEIAKKRSISMAQVAIAWVLAKDEVTAPIVGTTSLQNLEDILGAIHVTLTPEEIKYLEEPYIPRLIGGHA